MSSLSIRVEGLAETLKGLREIDRELPTAAPGSTPPTHRCGPSRRA